MTNSAWLDLVNLDGSDEHMNLCNAALMEVQQVERIRTLRLVANALAEMAGFKASTMETVDVVMLTRDLVMTNPSIRMEDALTEAQKSLGRLT
ncbi:hypothetical protein [Staphylococcus pasteuri]|uniref:hypothetical protein n=1 Tax=Staphylococcus pasteuri TaxID=45972 RepID=UPI0036F9D470